MTELTFVMRLRKHPIDIAFAATIRLATGLGVLSLGLGSPSLHWQSLD